MDLKDFHFAYPLWLFGLLLIPLIWALIFFFDRRERSSHQLEKFIDPHLLPYLLMPGQEKKRSFVKTLLLWSAVWACLAIGLAGPRWSYREIETFSKDQSLVILLDLSESMNASDIKPSRLIRAKQKIEDLINLSAGVKMGLIAFAADPHMIAPITDDKEMIRHLLPSLETDLVYIQGSKLSVALNMASAMLDSEPGSNKALLIMSDGGFEDASAIGIAKQLGERGIVIHAMGVGTLEGAPLKDPKGNILKRNGAAILSRLEEERLQGIAEAGKGYYLGARYSDRDEVLILKDLEKRSGMQENVGKKNKLWDERFYLLLLPALPIVLFWFRRGSVFATILVFLMPIFGLEAASVQDLFKNSEELGKQALEAGNYETAIHQFKDPYRKGVAFYKAGRFAESEEMFKRSTKKEVALQSAYNLGNALAQQQKFKEAITAYETVLKKWPECINAQENLELIKNMMQEQESSDQKDGDKDSQGEKEGTEEKEGQDQKGESESKDSKETEDSQSEQENTEKKEDTSQIDPSDEPKDPKEASSLSEDDGKEEENPEQMGKENQTALSQEDQDANLWLNQLSNDPKAFLKNKFYIESKTNGTTKGVDPW